MAPGPARVRIGAACANARNRLSISTAENAKYGSLRGAAPHADWQATPSLSRMRAFVEVKTVWHPMGV